ncbi:hypothetical protein GCM10010433_30220 [Streptomyces pulveraceus]
MYMSMQEETNFLREASVAATSEKYFEYVQPPSETTILRFGWSFFSFFSWLKFPRSVPQPSSATPSTDWAALNGRA